MPETPVDLTPILGQLSQDLRQVCHYLAYNVIEQAFISAHDSTALVHRAKSQSAPNPFALPPHNQKRGVWRDQSEIIKAALGPRVATNLMALHRQCHYLGLRNLGASCYMNSYLQALYMNPTFRSRLFKLWPHFTQERGRIVFELGRLFAILQSAPVSVGDPSGVARSLSVSGETQEDMTELMTLLLTALENDLAKNDTVDGTGNLVELFRGEIENCITCTECKNRSARLEEFQELRVQTPLRSSASSSHISVSPSGVIKSPRIPRRALHKSASPTITSDFASPSGTSDAVSPIMKKAKLTTRNYDQQARDQQLQPEIAEVSERRQENLDENSRPMGQGMTIEPVIELGMEEERLNDSPELPTSSPESDRAKNVRKRRLLANQVSGRRGLGNSGVCMIAAGSGSDYLRGVSPNEFGSRASSPPLSGPLGERAVELEKLLASLFQSEVLRKDNQYYCEKCEKRVDAVKEQTLVNLPPYLQICFERYRYDSLTGDRIKLLHEIVFPGILDVKRYHRQPGRTKLPKKRTARGLTSNLNTNVTTNGEVKSMSATENESELTTSRATRSSTRKWRSKVVAVEEYKGSDVAESDIDSDLEMTDPDIGSQRPITTYELIGVLEHLGGSATSGHYRAKLRDLWYTSPRISTQDGTGSQNSPGSGVPEDRNGEQDRSSPTEEEGALESEGAPTGHSSAVGGKKTQEVNLSMCLESRAQSNTRVDASLTGDSGEFVGLSCRKRGSPEANKTFDTMFSNFLADNAPMPIVVNDSENHPLPVLSTVDPTLGPCQSSFDDCFGPFQSRFEADDFYLPAAKRFRAREVLPAGGGLLGGTQSLCNDVSAVEDERRVKRRKVIFNNSKEEIMPIKGETENIEAPNPTLSRNNLTTGPCSRWSARDFGTIISPGDPRRYRWIEFDDQVVRAWNPLGGNEDEPDFRAKLFTSDTAYMLLYKRTDVPAGRDCTLPTGLQEFVDTLTRDHVEKETLYEDRSTVIKQVYSTAKKNTSRFIPRVNTATQQLRREWDSMTKGENAVLRAKVLQERILPKLSCVPRLWWSAMTQGDEGTSLCAAYEPWRRNDLVIIQDASNPFSAQLTTVDMRQDRPDWGPLSVDEKWLCAHRLGAAPAHVTEGSFRFVPKTVFEPWPVLSAVKEDSDASSADESQSIRIHPGMSIQALARMSVPQALCERCSEIMLAAASVSSRMLSVLEEVIKSVTRNGGTSSPSDSDSTAKSLHLHGSYYVSRKALTRLQGALTPPDPIKGGPGGHKSGNSRLSKNSRNSNGISELERQVAHIRAGMRLVRKDMRHLSQITQAGWDTTIQDKWIVPLTADLRCPHGQVMTSNGRVRGVWVASHLLEDLNQQDEVKAALLMEILGVFPELFPPRRLRLEADAPPTQAAHLAEEACEECLRDSSERTKEAKQTRKNRNLIRTMLPPGHFDMLMNPRYFMLTQALVRGRRNTIYLPAEGCHVIVPSSILSDWRRSSGVKGTTFATKPKLNSNFTKEDAMNAIETYFSGLAEYEMAKMAAWWTSSAFHSFNADVPIGGSSVMTSNPDNSDAPTATLAAASNGGYLVYIPTFHTQRDQMALIPLDTWENLITKDGNSAGLPQIAVRIERHEISGRKVFAASDDIELGVGSAGGPLRSLRLEILLPDVAVADISVLMRVPTAGLNTISGRHLTNQMGSSLVVMRGPAKTALMPLAVNTFHEYDFVATSFYLKEPGATT